MDQGKHLHFLEKNKKEMERETTITEAHVGEDTVEEATPKVGMMFNSEEEIRNYYHKYAYRVGFGVRKASSKTDTDRQAKYYSLGCARGGKYVSVMKDSLNSRPSIKTDCKAKINVIVQSDGTCTISRVCLEHNHSLSPKNSRFQRPHKKINPYSKRKLESNDQVGISLDKDLHPLVVEVGGYENLPFGEKDCKNYISEVKRLRLGVGDAEALRNYFVRMQKRNLKFFYVIDMDDEGRLRNVFWADARARAAYQSFGDVISFDTTYLTDRYNVPLASFVGMNHHGQSILFGCSLLSGEDKEMYSWLFRSWLECMGGRTPKAVITDQSKVIQQAVAEVFPLSRHRLCLWHIMKKLPQKLGELAQYKAIKKVMKSIVYESMDLKEFDERWSRMIEDFGLENNEWLNSLFLDRDRWVPIYVKRVFWAGMSTTQRSESMNAIFDDYVNSKTSVKQFVELYDSALKSKVEKERKADFDSLNSTYKLITDYHFEKQFRDAYTNDVFKRFQDELLGMLFCNSTLCKANDAMSTFSVTDILVGKGGQSKRKVSYLVCYNEAEGDVRCSCFLFEFRGIICRHIAKILIEKDVKEIPSCYILTRWRKDVKHRQYYVGNCYEDLMNSERDLRFDKLCTNFHEVADDAANSQETYELWMKYIDEGKKRFGNDLDLGSLLVTPAYHEVEASSSRSKQQSPLQVSSK